LAISDIAASLDGLNGFKERNAHHPRAADMIRETLRDAILDSQLAPGTWLREEELARYFGVSRTPVREALQVLRSEGLVEAAPNLGARVAALTTDDVLALYLVREVLDGLAARLATTRMSPAQWERIDVILDEMQAAAVVEDTERLAELNLQFHRLIRQAANNTYLNRFMEQVEHGVQRFSDTIFAYPGRGLDAVREHHEICDAMRAGDSARAERLAIEHAQRARQLKLKMLIEGY